MNYVYPLGSVVALKEDAMEVVIVSYNIKDKNKNYEYVGCGLIDGYDPERVYVFNNDEILYPIFIGQNNQEMRKITELVGKKYSPPIIHFLPVGSVVSLKNKNRVMIIGFLEYDIKEEKFYEYLGIDYEDEMPLYFNKEDITDILFVGMQTESSIGFSILLEELNRDLKDGKNIREKYSELMKKMLNSNEQEVETLEEGGS